MKTIRKTIYKVDRAWFDVDENRVVGDMYYTFQESDTTRTTDINQLILNVKDGIANGDGITDEKNIPVYLIFKGIAYLEIEDDDTNNYDDDLTIWNIEGRWEEVYSIAACSREFAEKIGFTDVDDFVEKKC